MATTKKWSAFPSVTATTAGDALVGLQAAVNKRFLVSTAPNASGVALWDANSNLSASNVLEGYATTATAAGTTVLTVASKHQQYFTGVTTQTVTLPVAATLVLGQSFYIVNNSTGIVTVQSSGANTVQSMSPGTSLLITCILASGTGTASWNAAYSSLSSAAPNPGITVTGTSLNPFLFTFSRTSAWQNGALVPYLLTTNLISTTTDSGITALDLGSTANLGGLSWTQTWAGLTTFTATNLVSIELSWNPVFATLTSISFPALVYCGAGIGGTCALLTSWSSPVLVSLGGSLSATYAVITSLSYPALTTVGGNFSLTCALLTSITLTNLSKIGGTVAASFAALTTLSFPALLSVGSTFTLTAANLVTFSFNAGLLSIGGNVTMTGMKLDVGSVDGILVSLAALDGTGGTTAWSTKTVNVSGGTSATPGAAGLAAKATLLARGCTVTTN